MKQFGTRQFGTRQFGTRQFGRRVARPDIHPSAVGAMVTPKRKKRRRDDDVLIWLMK